MGGGGEAKHTHKHTACACLDRTRPPTQPMRPSPENGWPGERGCGGGACALFALSRRAARLERRGAPSCQGRARSRSVHSAPRAAPPTFLAMRTHMARERESVYVCGWTRPPFIKKKKKNSTGNFHFALAAGSAAATWRTPAAAGKTVAEEHRCWGRGEVVVGIVLCEEASRWRRLQRPGRCHVNDNERSAAKWLPILHTALSLFSRAPRASLSLLPVRDQPED